MYSFAKIDQFVKIEKGVVVASVPDDASGFCVSGGGYLCCRSPGVIALSERPITDRRIGGVVSADDASPELAAASGLSVKHGERLVKVVLKEL